MAIHLGYIRPVITLERDRSATQGLLFNEFAHVALQCIVFNVEQWVGGGGESVGVAINTYLTFPDRNVGCFSITARADRVIDVIVPAVIET